MAEHNSIKVTVTFPLAEKPFQQDFGLTASVGAGQLSETL
jgi:hypothetical protein